MQIRHILIKDHNLLNWSYLPFLFYVIALQSIELELSPFNILRDCIAIY